MFSRQLGCVHSQIHHILHRRCIAHFSTSPLSTCIVGSGPSGMYTAKYLLKKINNIRISIIDELPTPFGLVRYGVAPDHADTKNVINDFTDSVLNDERVSYFGNVKLNETVSIQQLQSLYDTVVLSYGANSDRKLGIKGEDLEGIYSSRQFVNWYNGHPYFVDQITDHDFLANESGNVVIIGQGNVAIDCARILASNIGKLSATDITQHALEKLDKFQDRIRNIYIVGRRGAVQASFTNKELREVISDMNEDCIATINQEEMLRSTQSEECQQEMDGSRAVKRKMSIFERAVFDGDEVVRTNEGSKKCVHFRFLLSPMEFMGDAQGRVNKVRFEKNELFGKVNEQRAKGMNEFVEIDTGLVLTSIGYKAQSVSEIESYWDSANNVVKHTNGKINDTGLYCAGWLKRGPSGIIGTNIPDAQQTVAAIVSDYEANKFENNSVESLQCEEKLAKLLNERSVAFVDKNGWFKIDEHEKAIGSKNGKPREKMTNIAEMLSLLSGDQR